MRDLISRQAAIDALEKVAELFPWRVPGNRDTYDRYNEAWNDAIERAEIEIEELPSAQPEINCSEFPNNSDVVGMQDDAISRQAAIDTLENTKTAISEDGERYIAKQNAIMRIDALPPAEPKKGRWISADAMFHGVPFYCSECGENTRDTVMGKPRWKFCPMCRAKMEVTE